MRDKITFLHAADLHLDSPFRGLSHLPETIFNSIHKSTFQAFYNLIQLAIQQKVDFVLLVGDLFDAEKQTLQSQIKLREQFNLLKDHNIQVYLSYGNHDYIDGNLHRIQFPDNVHIFNSEDVTTKVFQKNQTKVNISGFSYQTRDLQAEKALEFPENKEPNAYHIGMYHGSLDGQVEHDTYAPFKLSQLESKYYDYWALGHIHKRQVIQEAPPVIYPGNIQGRHRKEFGSKGCYIVTMTEEEVDYSFHLLSEIEFINEEISLDNYSSLDELEAACQERMKMMDNKNILLHLTFTTQVPENIFYQKDYLLEELVEVINDKYESDSAWRYIYKYKFNIVRQTSIETEEPFQQELATEMKEIHVEKALDEMKKNKTLRKILDVDQVEILEKAKENIKEKFFS